LEFPLIPHPDYDDTHYPGHHQSQEGDHIESQPVPKQDAFNRAFNRLAPETLRDSNQLVVQAAVQLGLEDGKTPRVDTTVVESNIHYPTDATLLWDAIQQFSQRLQEWRAIPIRADSIEVIISN